jgi:hypothetical protein
MYSTSESSAAGTNPQVSRPDLISCILGLLRWDAGQLEQRDVESHQGQRRKEQSWQIFVGLVAHCLPFTGRFSQCLRQHFGMSLSDSALSQRRQRLGSDIFKTIMQEPLRPLADAALHPGCFLGLQRLVGIDGTTWSVSNTPQQLARIVKADSRRGSAAFAKIALSALVELGTHAPLRAAIGLDGESEQALGTTLLADLPQRILLILDRLYGQVPMLAELQEQCSALKEQHYLVRVRGKLGVQVSHGFEDGSALVEVELRDKVKKRQVLQTLEVREVRGRVWQRVEKKWVEVRLWTSLSLEQASASELIALYARRWEQEVFYRELKLQVARGDLLQSHTPETAVQEVAALLMACALVAQERLAVAAEAGGEVEAAGAVRISLSLCLSLCLEHTLALWLVLSAAQGLMDEATQRELVRRVRQQIAACALPPRRARSCQRKVRQPVRKWPRMISPTSTSSPSQYEVTRIA